MNAVGECVCRTSRFVLSTRGERAADHVHVGGHRLERVIGRASSSSYERAARSTPPAPNCGIQNRFRFGSLPTMKSRIAGKSSSDRRRELRELAARSRRQRRRPPVAADRSRGSGERRRAAPPRTRSAARLSRRRRSLLAGDHDDRHPDGAEPRKGRKVHLRLRRKRVQAPRVSSAAPTNMPVPAAAGSRTRRGARAGGQPAVCGDAEAYDGRAGGYSVSYASAQPIPVFRLTRRCVLDRPHRFAAGGRLRVLKGGQMTNSAFSPGFWLPLAA